MEKISELTFCKMKEASVCVFIRGEDNQWLLQMTDYEGITVFIPIEQQSLLYYKMKPLKTFTQARLWILGD